MAKKHESQPAVLPQSAIVADQPKGCVLLVEDDRSVRRYLEVTLQRAGAFQTNGEFSRLHLFRCYLLVVIVTPSTSTGKRSRLLRRS